MRIGSRENPEFPSYEGKKFFYRSLAQITRSTLTLVVPARTLPPARCLPGPLVRTMPPAASQQELRATHTTQVP